MTPEEKELLTKILEQLQVISTQLLSNDVNCSNQNYKIVIYLVPIFGIVFGSTLLFFVFFWWHRQKIEMIKAKIYKPVSFDFRLYSFFLGLLLTFTGFVLSIVFIAVLGNSLAVLGGVVPLAIGLSLLTFYKLQK
ncbi:MAG: hypothetical protein KDK36_04250 [Leptospiraceae bacterium]|nr:hypothetical protein [Leptospiraceae bacterium]